MIQVDSKSLCPSSDHLRPDFVWKLPLETLLRSCGSLFDNNRVQILTLRALSLDRLNQWCEIWRVLKIQSAEFRVPGIFEFGGGDINVSSIVNVGGWKLTSSAFVHSDSGNS